jgi:hypothetical protein
VESALFNGLQPIQIKKFCPISGSAPSASSRPIRPFPHRSGASRDARSVRRVEIYNTALWFSQHNAPRKLERRPALSRTAGAASLVKVTQARRRRQLLRSERSRWAHWPTPIKTPLWSSVAYPPAVVVPVRPRFETMSDQPGSFRGSKVMPPSWFGVITQTGREPAHNRLAMTEIGRFDERRHWRAVDARGIWSE